MWPMRRRRDSDLAELERLDPVLHLQMRVSRMLGFGLFLTVIAAGVGSPVAVVLGLRARKLIRRGGGQVVGMRMAWWCIIAGSVETAVTYALLAWLFIRQANA